MARNVLHKKKRITHMGSFTSETLDESRHVPSNCIDYVSSIIHDMDSDFKNATSNKIDPHKKFTVNKITAHVLLPDHDISATRHSKPMTSKLKKFSLRRKFPLMKKSQRILKHIKHNRSIPKPRAHLASGLKSPIKCFPLEGSKLLRGGVKKLQKSGNYQTNIVSSSTQSIKKPNNSICENKEKPLGKNNKLVSNKKPQNCNDSVDNFTNSTCRQNSIGNSDAKKSARENDGGETTDSEYERFVQNTKRELPARSSNKTKLVRKKKFSKKSKKPNVLSNKDDANESDCDNSNMHQGEKIKVSKPNMSAFSDKKGKTRLKSSSKRFQSNIDDDSSSMSSSSEQDEIADYSFEMPSPVESDSMDDISMDDISNKRFCADVTTRPHDVLTEQDNSISTTKDISSDTIPNTATVADKIVPKNYLQTRIEESDKDQSSFNVSSAVTTLPISVSNEINKTVTDFSTVIDLCQSSINVSSTATSLPISLSNEINNKTVTDFSTVIDLCSDSEPENNVLIPILEKENISETSNKDLDIISHSVDSEDSDLEVIEVISLKPTNVNVLKTDNITKNHIFQESNNNNSSSLNVSSEISCNKDSGTNSASYDTNEYGNKIKIKKENENKHDAAYVTNICKDFCKDKAAGTSHLNDVIRNINSLICEKDSAKLNISSSSIYLKECLSDTSQNIYPKQFTNPVIALDEISQLKKKTPVETASRSSSKSFITSNVDLSCVQNAEKLVKREILDDDIIIIDDIELSEKNDSKANSSSNATCGMFKSEGQQIDDEKSKRQVKSECQPSLSSFIKMHLDQYKEKSCNFENSEIIKKELHLLDTVFPNSNMLNDPKLSHDIVDNFKTKLSKLDESGTIDRKDIIHLVELYKKEFKNYQKIVKTEQNVEAGLKLIEAYQADKLKDIRSLIQHLLKNDSTFSNTYSFDIKEEPENIYKTSGLNSVAKSSNLTSSKKHSEDNSEIVCLPDIPPNMKSEKVEISSSSYEKEASTSFSPGLVEGKQTLKLLGKHCNVCGKDAIAACQRCAKAFFCSDRCGKIFWSQGHEKICG